MNGEQFLFEGNCNSAIESTNKFENSPLYKLQTIENCSFIYFWFVGSTKITKLFLFILCTFEPLQQRTLWKWSPAKLKEFLFPRSCKGKTCVGIFIISTQRGWIFLRNSAPVRLTGQTKQKVCNFYRCDAVTIPDHRHTRIGKLL